MKKFKVYASCSKGKSSKSKDAVSAASALDNNSPELRIIENYLPPQGEGETMASQVSTAVNKLVYKWFNDGDVYDNNYGQTGWANDLSSYANWLHRYANKTVWGNIGVRQILEQIYDCGSSEDAYEDILAQLVKAVGDAEFFEAWEKQPKQGSVYDCDGPFSFSDDSEEDEDYEEDYEEEEDEEEEW